MTDKEIAMEMTIALIAKDQYVSAVDAAKVFQLLHKVVSDPTITITEELWPKGQSSSFSLNLLTLTCFKISFYFQLLEQ